MIASISGCAVPTAQVNDRFSKGQAEASGRAKAADSQRKMDAPLVRVPGNFVGGTAVELGYKATLPSSFSDVTLRFPETPYLHVLAERITEATRLPVSVHPDALTSSSAASGGGSMSAASGSAGMQTARSIQMDFRGNLADYLDALCARLGLGWTYNSGTIDITRNVTRIFQLAASPGATTFGSRVSKGSIASSGATGGAVGQTTGSFNGSSDSAVSTDRLSPWSSLSAAITGILTPSEGRFTLNESTGTVVVTDTRMVVDQVGKLIESENSMLTRQMSLQVEMLTIQLNDQTELGVDAELVYKALGGGWSAAAKPAGSVATANTGTLSFNVLSGRAMDSRVIAKAMDGIGRIVQNTTTTLVTTNRVPVPLAQFATTGYLASTTAAIGGGSGPGSSVPGLTPGSVTTGLFLSALPTILDNNNLLVRLSIDTSTLLGIQATSTGSGSTFQQIQYPNITGYKSDHNITMRTGDALVLVGLNDDIATADRAVGLLSNSLSNKKTQSLRVIIVTPRIQAGV